MTLFTRSSFSLPTEPLLHLTSVFIPILLWLFSASELCSRAFCNVHILYVVNIKGIGVFLSTVFCPVEYQTLSPGFPLPFCPGLFELCLLYSTVAVIKVSYLYMLS